MSFASRRWPAGRGLLLYHEYQADVEQRIPAAQAAWKFLIEPEAAIPELRPGS